MNNNNNNSNRNNYFCDYCDKNGHTEVFCHKKKNDARKAEKATAAAHSNNSGNQGNGKGSSKGPALLLCLGKAEMEALLKTSQGNHHFNNDVFIVDSGATSHMRFSLDGMCDLVDWRVEITVGNSEIMWSAKKGTYKGTVLQQDGSTMDVVLSDVLYVPKLWVNLFSLTRVLQNPNIKLSNVKDLIKLEIGTDKQMIFDKVFKSGKDGQLLGVTIQPSQQEQVHLHQTNTITYQQLHEKLGHANSQVVKHTAKTMGIEITDKEEPCVHCALGKIKRTKIPKQSQTKATTKLERVNIDISYVKHTSFGGAKYWLLIQDEYTDYLWSYFLKSRDELTGTMLKWINEVQKESNNKVKTIIRTIRCDGSGEKNPS